MAINLQKGQKVDLTKGNPGLAKLMVGLGWDPVENGKSGGGFLKGILGGGGGANIDCDASVFLLDQNKKLTKKENLIYFGNLKSKCGSVRHMGDNLTGQGDGDDEQIHIELNKVPADINYMVFVVNIYDCAKRKQDFGMIKNAFIRILNEANNQELLKFNLTDNYAGKTSLIVSEVYRHNGEWKFAAVGEGTTDTSLGTLSKRFV
ncbi:MAG: TerD family protein [Firmicutes bacterium]|nr:TerD family protein [Bacillota bacterium]